jgi:uncharacterized protein YmfQ (DUF2313 family)
MARSQEEYGKMIQSLLPPGIAFNKRIDSELYDLLVALGAEFNRSELSAEDLILVEKDTRYTDELLTDLEEEYGIPEEGAELSLTVADRRLELNSKFKQRGQQYASYFEDVADALGYDIIIEEFRPAWVGTVTVGETVGDQDILFFWYCYIDIDSVTESAEVNLTNLIANIDRIKPGHTICLYEFYNIEFGRGFSRAFDRIPHYDNSWIELDFDSQFSNAFANNSDYDGVNYIGAFSKAFTIAHDRMSGGYFEFNEFSNDFNKPN